MISEKIGLNLELDNISISGVIDSWPFSKRGLKATAIACLIEKTILDGWHSKEDTPKII